ncbi:MAG: hypothetical protein LBO70_04685 [Clostridiales Family XIII bacterium]|jgi:hypothetical protein|nr:hypothetical protein [Clostridiales Family XIII bacterium]
MSIFAGTLFLVLICAFNFGISVFNAYSVGKIWTEVKYIGGAARVVAVSGYIMAVAGFTMVYSVIIIAIIGATHGFGYLSAADSETLLSFIGDLSYILIATAIIPTGIIITINSMIRFWKRKTLGGGMIAGWNTFASIHNVVTATRAMPSAFGRIMETVKSNRNNGIVVLAIVIVALCVLGGYFTASAIVKRADRKYDLFEHVAPGYAAAGGGAPAPGPMPGYAGAGGGAGYATAPETQNPSYDQPSQPLPHPSQRSMAERETELRRRQGS